MNCLCHQPHPQRPADFSDGVVARLCIGSERLVQGFAGQAGGFGNLAHAARPGNIASCHANQAAVAGVVIPNTTKKILYVIAGIIPIFCREFMIKFL